MFSMKNSLKRDLLFGIVLSALAFLSALLLGGPFLATGASAAPAFGALAPAQTTTLRGFVTHNGRQVYLNDEAGNVYQLENIRPAHSIEDRYVTVTGEVDSASRLIHVVQITPVRA
jgi:hypothetical protein